jgi:predicted DsbA family dithiol-disulfide isomerase
MAASAEAPLRVDIVSDVVCPWCFIGWRQLQAALAAEGVEADVRWHPFELNPAMPPEGEAVADHLRRKYGASPQQAAATRGMMRETAAEVGIALGSPPRIYNTRDCHRLLHWARDSGKQTALKEALFQAYFEAEADLGSRGVLLWAVEAAGLDPAEAAVILAGDGQARAVEALEARFAEMGISGVPAMIFDARGLVMGAQGVETYRRLIARVLAKRAERVAAAAAGAPGA